MILRTFSQAETNLTHLFAVILLCFGYFNYVFIMELIAIFLHISSLIGQILVKKFLILCNCIVDIVVLTYSFFQILYEDSLIFLKDATEKFTYAVYLFKKHYLILEELGWNFLKVAINFIQTTFHFFGFLYHIIGIVKQGIHFIGTTIWGFFINIPKAVVSNIFGIGEFLVNTFYELLKCIFKVKDKIFLILEKTYLFLFDIPLDSVCGLIIGAVCLTIFCVKFKDICYLTLSGFSKLYHLTVSVGVSLWSGQFLENKTKKYNEYIAEDNERLCTICQYRLKEIIIFPCKHLCLCGDCSEQLLKYQPMCPICRSEITETLKVYI